MKLLNLDELAGNSRPVVLNGVEYQIREQTVQQLIESVRARKKLNADDSEAMFEALVASAKAVLPDAPEKEIRNLNVTQLQALIKFASESDEALEQAVEEEEEGK
ncbi:hypothetical protein N7I40_004012 [Vibrio parahaemolyticus]|uniref:hypothetical protein n=1 Tax=Vibrio harveyi group TaxID=717610 RepID=UPI00063D9C03|nr:MULTISPECIES: hypothetical protein [Vibrio harveyi group]EGR3221641.1 hypothetical protein [Vibrio parahaemolyticus]EHK6545755.1 hypothetical protein [Vibrio parahaemolyticus]EJL8716064.1 hypothetical protein [Vibrio alginolyticus]EJV5946386.1 hypothetical protein [Vibrio parahaemolyticus]EKN4564887.1 hypothetical protein [Vibrio parahaemolyticus]